MKAEIKCKVLFFIMFICNIFLIFGGAIVWDIDKFPTLGGWMIAVGVVTGICSLVNLLAGNHSMERLFEKLERSWD